MKKILLQKRKVALRNARWWLIKLQKNLELSSEGEEIFSDAVAKIEQFMERLK